MPLYLLRHQMVLRYLQLLAGGICVELQDLHPVEQRPRHRVKGVGRGYEQYVGQVHRELYEVIPESLVLLAVQHFEKGGRRVSPHVGAHLVHFVQQHHRVH